MWAIFGGTARNEEVLAEENAYGKDGQRFHCIVFGIMSGIIVGVFIFISLLIYQVHFGWPAVNI